LPIDTSDIYACYREEDGRSRSDEKEEKEEKDSNECQEKEERERERERETQVGNDIFAIYRSVHILR